MRECRSPSHSGWEAGASAHDRIADAQPRPTSRFNLGGSSKGPVAERSVEYKLCTSMTAVGNKCGQEGCGDGGDRGRRRDGNDGRCDEERCTKATQSGRPKFTYSRAPILISDNRRMGGCIKAVRLNEGVSQLRARARGGEKRMHMHMRNVRSRDEEACGRKPGKRPR